MNISKKIFLLLLSLFISEVASKGLTFPFYIEKNPEYKPELDEKETTSKQTSFAEIPTAPVVLNDEQRACIDMCFGNKPQCFKMVIQTGSFYMWLAEVNSDMNSENKFDSAKSKTIERNRTQIQISYLDDKSIIGYTVKDDIYIEDKKIFRGSFILAVQSDSFTNTEAMIGLGYYPSSYEESFSFLEQLYKEKIIFHKVFTQTFSTSKNGEITFGEISKRVIEDYKHYGRCEALDRMEGKDRYKNKSWQCSLTGVFFGDTYEKSKVKKLSDTIVSFFSYRKRALVPLTFFDYLEKSYFKELIESGDCERTVRQRYDTFSCNKDITSGEDFTLLFGDWGMKIPSDKLFKYRKKNEAYEFIFYHKKNFEKYSLGRPIVQNFEMVYDAHNSEIGFYNKENVIYVGERTIEPPKIHEYIPDKESSKKPNPGQESKRPIIKPDTIIKPTETDKSKVSRPTSRTISNAFIIQMLLLIFVILVTIVLCGFGVYLYARYRRKTKFENTDFYVKQTDELINTTISK